MREIKFKGLGVDGKWWYGETKPQGENHVNLATFFANLHAGAINPETLGEYTGLHDKKGTEIYEGDILCSHSGLALPITVGKTHSYRFMWGKDLLCKADSIYGKVIGNIYENTELMEVRNGQAAGMLQAIYANPTRMPRAKP